ncbi:hypothetical protein EMPG_13711, partial [Blastomyces silverae]
YTDETRYLQVQYRLTAASVTVFGCDDGGAQDLMASRQPYFDGFHHSKLDRWWRQGG